jgi:hypothetical protein
MGVWPLTRSKSIPARVLNGSKKDNSSYEFIGEVILKTNVD